METRVAVISIIVEQEEFEATTNINAILENGASLDGHVSLTRSALT